MKKPTATTLLSRILLAGGLILSACSSTPDSRNDPWFGGESPFRIAVDDTRSAGGMGPASVNTDQPMATPEPLVLRLSLAACLDLMETRNREAMLERLRTKVAEADLVRSGASTDIILFGSLGVDRTERPLQSRLSGDTRTESIETDTTGIIRGTLPFETGTSIELEHSFRKVSTNSPFSTFEWDSSLGLSVRQRLLDGFGLVSGGADRKIANLNLAAVRGEVSQSLLNVRFDVAQAYWALVQAREEMAVIQSQRESAAISVRAAEFRRTEGLDSELDVLRARSTLSARERDLISQQLEVLRASDALLRAVNPDLLSGYALVPGFRVEVIPADSLTGDFTAVPVPEVYSQLQLAVIQRADLQAAVRRIEAAGVRLRQRERAVLPTLDAEVGVTAQGNGDDYGSALSAASSLEGKTYGGSLIFEMPLGNSADEAARMQADADLQRAMIQLRDVESQVIDEVVDAIRSIEFGNLAVQAAITARNLAREEFAAAEFRKRIELGTSLEIKDAEAEVASRERDVLRERVLLELARLRLLRATGSQGN